MPRRPLSQDIVPVAGCPAARSGVGRAGADRGARVDADADEQGRVGSS